MLKRDHVSDFGEAIKTVEDMDLILIEVDRFARANDISTDLVLVSTTTGKAYFYKEIQ
jgi:hypothetical protein